MFFRSRKQHENNLDPLSSHIKAGSALEKAELELEQATKKADHATAVAPIVFSRILFIGSVASLGLGINSLSNGTEEIAIPGLAVSGVLGFASFSLWKKYKNNINSVQNIQQQSNELDFIPKEWLDKPDDLK